MAKSCTRRRRGSATGLVVSNAAVRSRFYRLQLRIQGDGSALFSQTQPGQFAELQLSSLSVPPADQIPDGLADAAQRQIILRRPFSYCDIEVENTDSVRLDFLYCVLGPGTVRMTTLKEGDPVSILGPLGNGFSVPEGKKAAVLVAGGMGAPPMQHLARFLSENHGDIAMTVIAGARDAESIPFATKASGKDDAIIEEFAPFAGEQIVTTDDGSFGRKGFVTVHLENWLTNAKYRPSEIVIFSCGPEAMLAEVAKVAEKHNVDCQVSMERMMACGIGLCQSCAVDVKQAGSKDAVYKLCCKDGPVFDSKDVVFGGKRQNI